ERDRRDPRDRHPPATPVTADPVAHGLERAAGVGPDRGALGLGVQGGGDAGGEVVVGTAHRSPSPRCRARAARPRCRWVLTAPSETPMASAISLSGRSM